MELYMDVHQHFQFLAKREGDYRPVKISHTYSLVLKESREEGDYDHKSQQEL